MTIRTTFDRRVVEKWARQLALVRLLKAWRGWVLAGGGLFALWLLLRGFPIAALLVLLASVTFFALSLIASGALTCPHCGKHPLGVRTAAWRLECCNYCHYRLRPPPDSEAAA